MMKKIAVFLGILLFSCSVVAGKTYLVINGLSKHYNVTPKYQKIGLNERHDGLGFEREYDSGWFYSLGWLKDSLRNTQPYSIVGRSFRYRYQWFEANFKINGLLSARKDRADYGKALFGILPSLAIGTTTVKLEVSYIPKFKSNDIPLVFIQLKIEL